MALTPQTVANDVNAECRHYFAAPGSDVSASLMTQLFIGWVDRIHKDVLYTSVWSPLIRVSETHTSTVGGSPYTLTANNIRHIISVYDVKNKRLLIPYSDLNYAAGTADPNNGRSGPPRTKPDQTQQTNAGYPQYYLVEACGDGSGATWGIHLLPDPATTDFAGTFRYYYLRTVDTLTASGDALTVPESGRDIIVAGVAMLASRFLKRPNDAEMWRQTYESLKQVG